jgi:hypothetical protein
VSYLQPAYLGADGQASAVLRRRGRRYDLKMGTAAPHVHNRATARDAFGPYRCDFTGPTSGPYPHVHKTISGSLYPIASRGS